MEDADPPMSQPVNQPYRPWSRSLWAMGLCFLVACGSEPSKSPETTKPTANEISAEVSLQGDRSNVEEYRKDVPTDIKTKNDEEAVLLEWMGTVRLEPSAIREKFDHWYNRTRDRFQSQSHKLRDKFNEAERKIRDAFMKTLKDERDKFAKTDSMDDRKTLYEEQDRKRKEFFEKEREQRGEFDSAMREKRDDFNANMDEKRRTFMDRLKQYTEKYNAQKKAEAAQKESSTPTN
jgi:hypothetical protein